jgi:hypothetical protein
MLLFASASECTYMFILNIALKSLLFGQPFIPKGDVSARGISIHTIDNYSI